MRDLRRIAAAPGEFEWRMELLAKIERMQVERIMSNQTVKNSLDAVQRELSRLSPSKLEITIDKRIEHARDKRHASTWRTTLKSLAAGMQAIAIAYLLWKLRT